MQDGVLRDGGRQVEGYCSQDLEIEVPQGN